jgi:hypothetical protein
MIRNAKVGCRVQVLDGYGRPINYGKSSYGNHENKLLGEWDYSLGNTGTIIDVQYTRHKKYQIRLTVEPDSPNFGQFVWFTPKQLRRLEEKP